MLSYIIAQGRHVKHVIKFKIGHIEGKYAAYESMAQAATPTYTICMITFFDFRACLIINVTVRAVSRREVNLFHIVDIFLHLL